MRLPIKLICRKNKLNGDGTTTVFIQYCYDADHKTLLHTGIKIPPSFWNKTQGAISNKLPAEFGSADSLNKDLWRQLRVVESLVTHAIQEKMDNKGGFVKKTFHPDMKGVTVEESINEAPKREVEAKCLIRKSLGQVKRRIPGQAKRSMLGQNFTESI